MAATGRRDERGIGRRTVVLGGAAVAGLAATAVLVEQDVLPGRSRLYATLGLNGSGAPFPDAPPGQLVSGTFVSAARGGLEVGWTVSYPRGTELDAELPVLLMLHGGSGDHSTPFDTLGMDRFLTLEIEDGATPFAIAAVDGGTTSWRPQPDGTDSAAMLTDEFLPLLADRGLDTGRLVLGGWSMGGYGALRLAGLGELPLKAVAVLSPALSETPPTDSDADDVYGHPERLAEVPVRIDCGHGDPFYPVVRDFVQDLDPAPLSSFGDGGHTPSYWRTVIPQQLRFFGEHLST